MIKSKCYVVYESEEQAVVTRNALHNLTWPSGSHKKLLVEFNSESEAKRTVLGEGYVQERRRDRSPKKAPEQEKEKKVGPTLDDLFKKTIAKPQIYYQPVTDAEAELRRKAATEAKQNTQPKAEVQNGERK